MDTVLDTVHRLVSSTSDSKWHVVAGTALATAALLRLSHLALDHTTEQIINGPRDTLLPKLGQKEVDALDYPPDALPGGRYVDSPYGVIRVYEWGPEDGRKVLFVHGITTPCIAVGAVAQGLVDKGCRVMLFVRSMTLLYSSLYCL